MLYLGTYLSLCAVSFRNSKLHYLAGYLTNIAGESLKEF